jgi:hypothetical protein
MRAAAGWRLRILTVLAIIMVLNLALIVLVRTAAKDSHQESPLKDAQEDSPYAPWPLSYPKMCGGILLFEKDARSLAVTPDQARRLLPILHRLGACWREIMISTDRVKNSLNAAQREYIFRNKHTFETTAFVRKNIPSSLGGNSLKAAAWVLEKRSKEPKGGASLREQPEDDRLLTIFDMATGIYMMDGIPDLAADRDQALALLPVFRTIQKPVDEMGKCTREMADLLSKSQIAHIQSHMLQVTHMKRSAFDGSGDKGPYGDRLIWLIIQLLEKRSGVKASDGARG